MRVANVKHVGYVSTWKLGVGSIDAVSPLVEVVMLKMPGGNVILSSELASTLMHCRMLLVFDVFNSLCMPISNGPEICKNLNRKFLAKTYLALL